MAAVRSSILICMGLQLLSEGALPAQDLTTRVQALLGIPYVSDGVQDEKGRWTTFSHREQDPHHPGLNCSGFTVVLARRLLDRPFELGAVTVDRLDDSGKNTALGQDWDFAWDLILNLSEGFQRRVMLPSENVCVQGTGQSLRGFPMEDVTAWDRILPRIQTGHVYLASISRGALSPRNPIHHYHSAVLLKDGQGHVWFYHTLPEGRSHRLDLSTGNGFNRMQSIFGNRKFILMLEVDP